MFLSPNFVFSKHLRKSVSVKKSSIVKSHAESLMLTEPITMSCGTTISHIFLDSRRRYVRTVEARKQAAWLFNGKYILSLALGDRIATILFLSFTLIPSFLALFHLKVVFCLSFAHPLYETMEESVREARQRSLFSYGYTEAVYSLKSPDRYEREKEREREKENSGIDENWWVVKG